MHYVTDWLCSIFILTLEKQQVNFNKNFLSYHLPFRHTIIVIILAILLLAGSFALLIIADDENGVIYLVYWVVFAMAFLCFCRFINYLQQARKNNQQQYIASPHVFPVYRFDPEGTQMEQSDYIPVYVFLNLAIVESWCMLFCFTNPDYDFYAIGVAVFALNIGVLYTLNVKTFV